MTAWQEFARSPDVQACGWILLDFIWQGALIALVLKCVLFFLRRHTAELRYWVSLTALCLLLCMPLLTFWKPRAAPAAMPPSAAAPSAHGPDATAVTRPEAGSIATAPSDRMTPEIGIEPADLRPEGWAESAKVQLEKILPWMAAFWLAGIVVAGTCALGGLIQANLLKRGSPEFALPGEMEYLISRSGVAGRVRLLESARVSVPTVVGWWRPAILFPAVPGIDPAHVRALLAHELAHVRRRDYLVNLFQAAVEVLLFFHAAVWWVSARVRAERECCCDDAAVKMCGDVLGYVRALSDAERRRRASKLAVALTGASLLDRIRRLIDMKTTPTYGFKDRFTGISAFVVLFAAGAGSSSLAPVPIRADSAAAIVPLEAKSQETAPVVQTAVPVQTPSKATAATRPPAPGPRAAAASVAARSPHREPQQRQPRKISGTILDFTGGVIPGAAVSIFDPETRQQTATTFSRQNGFFEIELPRPDCQIQFSTPGFQTQVLSGDQIGPGPLTIEMELGQVKEVVTVVTAAKTAGDSSLLKEPIRVGGNVVLPRLARRADPVYPPDARDANIEGTVIVSALIDEEGNVKDPVVLKGHRLLRSAALDCVSQWQYRPALVNGEAHPVRLSITINFRLDRD